MTSHWISGATLAVVGALVSPGCVSMMAPSPQMADSMAYVRQHKGEGFRRVLVGTEAQLMDEAAGILDLSYAVTREPHALFAKYRDTSISFSYAFYFYPTPMRDRTEVESLLASNWSSAGDNAVNQKRAVADFFPLAYISTRLLEPDFDPNTKERELLPLSVAAMYGSKGLARKLIGRGAQVDAALTELKDKASRNREFLDRPENRRTYEDANAGVALLETVGKDAAHLEAEKANEARFQEALRAWQSAAVKPQLPESARRFKVQAEDAARNKRFEDAANLFAEALQIAPWWPEGHFNRAVILGELGAPGSAILEMKRYLRLVPNAPNARAAQDKIYIWEGQAK